MIFRPSRGLRIYVATLGNALITSFFRKASWKDGELGKQETDSGGVLTAKDVNVYLNNIYSLECSCQSSAQRSSLICSCATQTRPVSALHTHIFGFTSHNYADYHTQSSKIQKTTLTHPHRRERRHLRLSQVSAISPTSSLVATSIQAKS